MERISDTINRWTEMAVLVIILAMAVDVFIEVIFRYMLPSLDGNTSG